MIEEFCRSLVRLVHGWKTAPGRNIGLPGVYNVKSRHENGFHQSRLIPVMARILVVDDDPQVSESIVDRLTFEEHTVTVAATSLEGWAHLQGNDYDLVILDWELPDGTGIDILRRFREAGGATPIIMLTGHTSIDDKESGLDSGANDYLTKPFSLKELSARIRAHLRRVPTGTAPPPPLGQGNEEVLKQGDLFGTRLAANYEFLEVLGTGASG